MPQSNHSCQPPPSRLMMGLAAILFVPLLVLGLWGVVVGLPAPRNVGEQLGKLLLEELLLAALIFFTLGLVWALFRPQWLAYALEQVARKTLWILVVFILQAVVLVIWHRWMR